MKGKGHKLYLQFRSFPWAEGKEQQRKEQRSPPSHPPTAAGYSPVVVTASLEKAQDGLSG